MRQTIWTCAALLALSASSPAQDKSFDPALSGLAQDKKKKEAALPPDSLYALKTKTLDGKDADLKDYAGKVALVVNLASQ